ncbi:MULTISPECIES: DUF6776 family protein [Pseudidiomarina]|uniref:Uncharacterized protein n=2 Tax=Pseudidiomarina TaxID=2800384 RepID=A0A368UUU6_9GAMM|nr:MULTISPECIES: DUF6776 family protein [Pseudidiomarina]PWW13384.1 hypothetical protein DET45_10698 [Pseudidiomarina maritima]RBP90851.1 hypothetical protein DFO81_10698 [Pseudidiomarina tainanensis]RCW32647.1 hypothetical protein DFO79_10698 [Pseudidiomarina tainanensis]
MKEKQNIIIASLLHRFGGWLVLAVVLGLGVAAGYWGGNWHLVQLQQQLQQQQATIAELYERTERFDYQQHIAQVELGIEQAASKGLQQELLMAQDENFALRRELAFYQKIMAPELEASGVMVDSFELQPNRSTGHFHFRLALVQMDRLRNLTKGSIEIRLSGRLQDQAQSYDLLELAHVEAKDRQFSMRYFTVQAGDFVVPEGFLPERIDVVVNVSGSKQNLSRSFYWADLLAARATASKAGDSSDNT